MPRKFSNVWTFQRLINSRCQVWYNFSDSRWLALEYVQQRSQSCEQFIKIIQANHATDKTYAKILEIPWWIDYIFQLESTGDTQTGNGQTDKKQSRELHVHNKQTDNTCTNTNNHQTETQTYTLIDITNWLPTWQKQKKMTIRNTQERHLWCNHSTIIKEKQKYTG